MYVSLGLSSFVVERLTRCHARVWWLVWPACYIMELYRSSWQWQARAVQGAGRASDALDCNGLHGTLWKCIRAAGSGRQGLSREPEEHPMHSTAMH